MLNFALGLMFGTAVAIIVMTFLAVKKEDLHPKQFETYIKEGLKGKFPFYIHGTDLEITPWPDGHGVIRLTRKEAGD